MKFGIIPVKEFSRAKERLSNLLSLQERRRLALVMYEDVLNVVTSASSLDRVVVISKDPTALDMAQKQGAIALEEKEQRGQSSSVDLASQFCLEAGATSVLSIPIDVPLITIEDIDGIMSMATRSPLVVLSPSRDERGTNAVLRIPPDVIRSHFGPDSFRLHLEEINERQIPYQVCRLPSLALDIDDPQDLALFLSRESQTKSYTRAIEMGLHQKIYERQKR